jgi:hypothetical protein
MVTLFNWRPIFEWWGARLEVKYGHQKHMATMRFLKDRHDSRFNCEHNPWADVTTKEKENLYVNLL